MFILQREMEVLSAEIPIRRSCRRDDAAMTQNPQDRILAVIRAQSHDLGAVMTRHPSLPQIAFQKPMRLLKYEGSIQ